MLTLYLLQFPATGVLRTKPSARELALKRITRIQKFFRKSASGQALRRDSLVLQLTSGVEAFMSAIPKDGEIPTLVALQQGKAHEILNKRLQRLLDVVHLDPDLNLSAATGALLGTAADLKARLDEYLKYPGKFVLMCRRWWPNTYKYYIGQFLRATTEELDVGFSLELQRLALAQEGEMQQRAFSAEMLGGISCCVLLALAGCRTKGSGSETPRGAQYHSSCECLPRSAL